MSKLARVEAFRYDYIECDRKVLVVKLSIDFVGAVFEGGADPWFSKKPRYVLEIRLVKKIQNSEWSNEEGMVSAREVSRYISDLFLKENISTVDELKGIRLTLRSGVFNIKIWKITEGGL